MRINNIQPTGYSFKSNDYVSKRILKAAENNKSKVFNSADDILVKYTALLTTTVVAANEILKRNGFTYCDINGSVVSVSAGYNGGYYSVDVGGNYTPEIQKSFFAKMLSKNDNLRTGGILNYKNMVSDLKRQDIIQKGLQIHTYAMNTKVAQSDAETTAERLSKLTKKYIKSKDLFYIDNDAYYYDPLEKIAYSVTVNSASKTIAADTYRTCAFQTDDKNNAIGYTVNRHDLFKRYRINEKYQEQQSVSEELAKVVNINNNKLYAEAFRFGNIKQYPNKILVGIPKVLEHLEKRVKIQNPTKEMLQVVNTYDKNNEIVTNICFYDSSIGRSLVYDDRGKYLYQMEYNKDSFGNIIACSKY